MAGQEASIDSLDSGWAASSRDGRAVLTDSLCHLSLFVQGKPVAKARPRTTRLGQTYTPAGTVTWEQDVGWQVREQLTRIAVDGVRLPMPFEGRVIIEMRFNFIKPKSTPKKVQHKLKKPDYDNLAKSITDVLQASEGGVGIFRDDSQVTDAIISKRFADSEHPEGVEIQLTCWLS